MKKCSLVILFLFFFSSLLSAQTFQSFIDSVNSALPSARGALVDTFMARNPHLPYYENDTTVYFVYRGNASRVQAPGDMSGWDTLHTSLSLLSTTNLWYEKKNFESDARLDYKFVLNGNNWILDPRNPNQVTGGLGPNSEVRMPGYVAAPEFQYYAGIPHGTLKDTTIFSTNMGNSRLVRVYLPPTYATTTDSFPVILFHDGTDYITLGSTANILDYCIAHNLCQPVIGVFVPPVNRQPEYAGTLINQFSAFVVNELIPYIDAHYRTRRDPHFRATMGSSDGGNISLFLAVNHPEVFGNVAAQSSDIISNISGKVQSSAKLDLKLYLDLGTYDIDVLIPLVHNFIPVLHSKGYDYLYYEYHEGHSWGNWRAHIDNALEYFFPGQALGVNNESGVPARSELVQNYPNPFNPSTNFGFRIAERGLVILKIYNMLGEEIATLVNEKLEPGSYTKTWNGGSFPSGIYFYRLQTETRSETKKFVLMK